MTLRDYLAAAALPAVVGHLEKLMAPPDAGREEGLYLGSDCSDVDLAAEYCYNLADAMLKHRLSVDQAPEGEQHSQDTDRAAQEGK